MNEISNFCDYFIICSGESPRQVRAIFDEALHQAKVHKMYVHHTEIDENSRWLLIDYFDVILHIFENEAREFYGLEKVWREAKKLRIPKRLTEKNRK